MWPNTDKRRLLMKSITGGKPVRADISASLSQHVTNAEILLRPVYVQNLALTLHVECLQRFLSSFVAA